MEQRQQLGLVSLAVSLQRLPQVLCGEEFQCS